MASNHKHKKKNVRSSEWSKTGSFMHKPDRGWIHPDGQLNKEGGICYGVRYIGCIEVKESMRALDFDTRTALARLEKGGLLVQLKDKHLVVEAIARVCEAAGLKAAKKRKTDKKLLKMLGDAPIMRYAGSNVNLTINTENLSLMIMESGEIIATHQMPGISFASGGDSETLDFVSYVAKDSINGRACHVIECGGGLSEDVITTIGQAFELRFKEYLKNQPKTMEIPDRIEGPIADGDAWGEDESEYYNDRPDAQPPLATAPLPLTEYATPKSNLPISDGVYTSVKDPSHSTYDTPKEQPLIDLSEKNIYDNEGGKATTGLHDNMYDNKENVLSDEPPPRTKPSESKDPFDMEPFNKDLPPPRLGHQNGLPVRSDPPPEPAPSPGHLTTEELAKNIAPLFEEWYHGALSRKQAEKLLQKDGDFLVRKSSTDPNQYVLSGKQQGMIKHLLLVDPDGVVRTKDHTFESVPHLIKYHRSNNLPIISQESELHLIRPVSNNYTNC